jgi:hypothetical protein
MRFSMGVALVALASTGPVAARAQSATQSIRMEIRPISQLAVRGTTSFTIPARNVGPATVVSSSASYAITTNEENRRITVAIDEPLPDGVTLRMRMDAPAGAEAADEVTLSTTPQTAVTGISRLNARDLGIDFSLTTGGTATVPSTTTRTVSVTLVSAP